MTIEACHGLFKYAATRQTEVNNKGFSTIELAVVLAIVALMSCVAIPPYMSWRANSQLRSAAREINAVFQRTRMEAIKQNTTLTIQFDVNGGGLRYRVFGSLGYDLLDDTVEGINFPDLNNMAVAFNSRGMVDSWSLNGENQGSQPVSINMSKDNSLYLFQVTVIRSGHSRIRTV